MAMEREPKDFERPSPEDDVAGMDDAAFSAWLQSLPPPPGLPSTPEEIAASDARAEADIAAGRVYSHELVGEWVKTFGSPDYKPIKEWLASRDG